MRAAVYHGVKHVAVQDIARPVTGPEDVILRVRACGICGSDVHTYNAGWYGSPGQIMGHEFSGEVVEAGSAVSGIAVGDRLCALAVIPCGDCSACLRGEAGLCDKLFAGDAIGQAIGYGTTYGALAEFVKVPKARLDATVFRLPPELSFEEGALVEPLSVAFHAVKLGNPELGDKVLVLGSGLIGLLVIQLLKARGCSVIAAVEVKPARQKAALASGADVVIDPTRDDAPAKVAEAFGKGRSPDVVFECAGVPATFLQAIEAVRPGGTVVMIAMHEKATEFVPSRIVEKGLRVYGSCGYSVGSDSLAVIDLLRQKKLDVAPLISHRFPLDKASEAFRTSLGDAQAVKILVMP